MSGRLRSGRIPGALLAGLLLVIAACGGGSSPEPRAPEDGATLSVSRLMSAGPETAEEGFARAREPRDFVFPADHGPHTELRTEWWYFTGHLAEVSETEAPTTFVDRPAFGFQLTLFRNALVPPGQAPERSSAWAATEVYLGHFALSDLERQRFHSFERFVRAGAGLAGAEGPGPGRPLRIWAGSWEISSASAPAGGTAGDDVWPLRLLAAEADDGEGVDPVALDLRVEPLKGPVLQGEEGLSPKGPEPGNASYYYSFPRLAARGTVTAGGRTVPVEGEAWLDRDWSTSALGPDLEGWDWFSLQLETAGGPQELMVYRLRRRDGSADPLSDGRWVAPDGSSRRLATEEVEITVLDRWTSPVPAAGGAPVSYPGRWHIRVPSEDLDLEVVPLLAAQELRHTVRYWEGAVEVRGTVGGEPASGLGYVELTGYGD